MADFNPNFAATAAKPSVMPGVMTSSMSRCMKTVATVDARALRMMQIVTTMSCGL